MFTGTSASAPVPRTSAPPPIAKKLVGEFQRDLPVLGTDNERKLQLAAGPQIADLYGTLFRSTPVHTGQLILLEVSSPNLETHLQGKYVGPVYPEAPKSDDPKAELAKIGVAGVRTPV